MRRLSLIGMAVLGMFAFGGVVAVVSRAEGTEGAPYWSIEGTRVAAGKTFEITAKSESAQQMLSAATDTVECATLKLKPGAVLLGSNGNEPGRGAGTIQYGKCKVTGNGTGCLVENESAETEPLMIELAYAENKKSLIIEWDPVKGRILATLHFKAEAGGSCTVATTKVTGLVVAKVLTDAPNPVLLELPNHVTQTAGWIAESPSTPIRHIWLITAGTGTLFETEELNAFGVTSVYTGAGLVSLTVHGTSLTSEWGPLL
jgi:hypothetical protein